MQKISKPIETYRADIIPKIKKLDIYLKSDEDIKMEEAIEILDMKEKEILEILLKLKQKEINNKNILSIIMNGNSSICNFIKREIKCGSPCFYTAKDIAYIYELDYKKVLQAYEFLEVDTVTTKEIPAILMQI